MYLYIRDVLIPRKKNEPIVYEKIKKLEKQFLELYVRAKTKEDEIEKETGKSVDRLFAYHTNPSKRNPTILGGLRRKKIRVPRDSKEWRNVQIHEMS